MSHPAPSTRLLSLLQVSNLSHENRVNGSVQCHSYLSRDCLTSKLPNLHSSHSKLTDEPHPPSQRIPRVHHRLRKWRSVSVKWEHPTGNRHRSNNWPPLLGPCEDCASAFVKQWKTTVNKFILTSPRELAFPGNSQFQTASTFTTGPHRHLRSPPDALDFSDSC